MSNLRLHKYAFPILIGLKIMQCKANLIIYFYFLLLNRIIIVQPIEANSGNTFPTGIYLLKHLKLEKAILQEI